MVLLVDDHLMVNTTSVGLFKITPFQPQLFTPYHELTESIII